MMGPLIGAGRQIADPVIYITAAQQMMMMTTPDCGFQLILLLFY
jgi:hypothetical protein